MHAVSDYFNQYPENAANADLYGIVMGSSHIEMLLRSTTKEWGPWASSHSGSYDYSVSQQSVYDFWDARVQTNGKYENGYSEGMRGTGDGPMVSKNASTHGAESHSDGADFRGPAQDLEQPCRDRFARASYKSSRPTKRCCRFTTLA